ncbi:topless-related protein 4-like [Rhodamnia argentea]|uniref:Topless-related protein 4-like n=1 Tax=Rhodamnia argentea TaxID=178133 RepID=A0ABM3HBU9_9MYRT|nr:topless-related protein 4-like [Rhodamnia argentea]
MLCVNCLFSLHARIVLMYARKRGSLVNNLPANVLPVTYNSQSSYSADDLPRSVVMTINQGSPVKSMDFHPVQQILLLGVAYSKYMVHIYLYLDGDDIRNHLEIEAHVGSVNDLAFSYSNKQLCVVTCGEDRLIKVWDAVTGAKQHGFEGHEAPFFFSTATDGKIKVWIYGNLVRGVDYDAPGLSSTMMAYSADGKRLFSFGTNKEGESYLVEWNQLGGAVKRTYHGLGKRPGGVVRFDTTKNRFLAAGEEFMVKFWDMDNEDILTITDALGGLPASPCIRFNKEGVLLAVSTSDSSIKILANACRQMYRIAPRAHVRRADREATWDHAYASVSEQLTVVAVKQSGEEEGQLKQGLGKLGGENSASFNHAQ